MDDRQRGASPGAPTAEDVERAERQPGRKGSPTEKGPSPGRTDDGGSGKGEGERPPNNSAPGAGGR